jgi:hypothetical protein
MAIWQWISRTSGCEDGNADPTLKIIYTNLRPWVVESGNARREPRHVSGKSLDSAPDFPNSEMRVLAMPSEREIQDTASATLAKQKKNLLEGSIRPKSSPLPFLDALKSLLRCPKVLCGLRIC